MRRARVDLAAVEVAAPTTDENLLLLDEALDHLAAEDPETAELVKLRYLVGLSTEETAAALGVSPATVKRRWTYARAWLYRQVREEAGA